MSKQMETSCSNKRTTRAIYNQYAPHSTLHLILLELIKPRRLKWVRCVVLTRKHKMFRHFLLENPKGRDHLRDVGINTIMLSKLILYK
jgi:hypothetical protein